jgi:hypothetical protein
MSLTVTSIGANAQVPGIAADAFIPDQLIAGPHQLVTDTVTIASGQVIARGAVLGQITASGKYVLALSASADGSQTPSAIAADNIDASAGDVLGGIYLAGEFNGNALTLGAGITLAAAKAALRPQSIYVKTAVSAADPT